MDLTIRLATPADVARMAAIDDDATALYLEAGLALVLADDHPFVVDEKARWARSIALDRAYVAVDTHDVAYAFATLDVVDDAPYLDQLSVHTSAMRRGLGRRLLHEAVAWARARKASALWLTTWAHLPWNAPFYAREGFERVPESECGPGIRHHLAEQRRWLPDPEERIAMRLRPLVDRS